MNMDDFKGNSRRSFLRVSAMAGAAALTGGLSIPAMAQKGDSLSSRGRVGDRRKLGSLEVSSVGHGCQDFTGTFYATAPGGAE